MKAYRKGKSVDKYDVENGWVAAGAKTNADSVTINFSWGEGQKKSDFMVMIDDVDEMAWLIEILGSTLANMAAAKEKGIDEYSREELTTELFNRL